MKLTAVLNARSGVIGVAFIGAWPVEKCIGLRGSNPCNRCIAYGKRKQNVLKEINDAV